MMQELLFRLCSAVGTPGGESAAADVAAEALSQFADVNRDSNGNVIATMGSQEAEKHIMLDAHLDQIGMVVTGIDDNGFLRIAPCGGVDRRVLPGAAVLVLGKEQLRGIVCCLPPHLTEDGEKKVAPVEELMVDIGRNAPEARALVQCGDRIVLEAAPCFLLNGRVTAPSLDDRAGVTVLVRCAQLLAQEGLPANCRVTLLCSTQEEVGSLGAKTAAFTRQPQEAIVVDVSFAQQPGVLPEKASPLGSGPMIGFAPTLDPTMSRRLKKLAQEAKIPYTCEVMGGTTGTNADAIGISRGGVRCATVSIPLRFMHTAAEVVELADLEHTARLLADYVQKGGAGHESE